MCKPQLMLMVTSVDHCRPHHSPWINSYFFSILIVCAFVCVWVCDFDISHLKWTNKPKSLFRVFVATVCTCLLRQWQASEIEMVCIVRQLNGFFSLLSHFIVIIVNLLKHWMNGGITRIQTIYSSWSYACVSLQFKLRTTITPETKDNLFETTQRWKRREIIVHCKLKTTHAQLTHLSDEEEKYAKPENRSNHVSFSFLEKLRLRISISLRFSLSPSLSLPFSLSLFLPTFRVSFPVRTISYFRRA